MSTDYVNKYNLFKIAAGAVSLVGLCTVSYKFYEYISYYYSTTTKQPCGCVQAKSCTPPVSPSVNPENATGHLQEKLDDKIFKM